MKILFIDYISPDAHIHSTKPQIKALSELGYDVNCVFRKGYFEKHGFENGINYLEIPEEMYPREGGGLYVRYCYVKILFYIWRKVKQQNWNYIVIQYYELFSLLASQLFKTAFIVDHNTVSCVDNRIKRFALKSLSGNMKHIVFNSYQQKILNENGIKNVFVVPMAAHSILKNNDTEVLTRYGLQKGKYVFCPSATSVDHNLSEKLCNDLSFHRFLSERGLRLVVKRKYKINSEFKGNVVVITDFLNEHDFNGLMLSCSFVLLYYKPSFTYRVSGVLLECIENNIKCLINDTPTFRAYEEYIKCDIFYKNVDEMIEKAGWLINEEIDNLYKPYNQSIDIKKSWKQILK